MNRERAIQAAKVIKALIGVQEVSIILSTFINAFIEKSFEHDDAFWLCGDLKFGPQSGRLASAKPNMQNLPSGSTYGKLIKSCFVAPDGYLFCGSDFNALEDRIGAILSGDRNKIKEFSRGFDGHSLRAHAFFSKKIHPELAQYDQEDPDSINQIKSAHSAIRSKAKAPSFLLQYGGSAFGLNKNIGIPLEDAEEIERAYHELYAGIAEFAEQNIAHAIDEGYVECAFGLRLRTPTLHRLSSAKAHRPYDAKAEGRSANNAVTQSWGMLINRALIATKQRLRDSEYLDAIRLCNAIHDAGYFLVRRDAETVKWLNDNLIEEMEWNDDPKIKSDEVKIGAELDIGLSWDKMLTLPNKASLEQIQEAIDSLD